MRAPSATPQPGQPAVSESAAHWCERPPKKVTPRMAAISQMTMQHAIVTSMLGSERRIDDMSFLSSRTRGTSMKMRIAASEARIRSAEGKRSRSSEKSSTSMSTRCHASSRKPSGPAVAALTSASADVITRKSASKAMTTHCGTGAALDADVLSGVAPRSRLARTIESMSTVSRPDESRMTSVEAYHQRLE